VARLAKHIKIEVRWAEGRRFTEIAAEFLALKVNALREAPAPDARSQSVEKEKTAVQCEFLPQQDRRREDHNVLSQD
jgi:hypothetical protein